MSDVDRREVVGWGVAVAAAGGASWGLSKLPSGAPIGAGKSPRGYGIDPPLTEPRRHVWPRHLGEGARRNLAALIDVVVPGTPGSPSGEAVGLVEFFDEWLGAPYPDMVADRQLLMPLFAHVAGIANLQPAARERRVAALVGGKLGPAFARFCTLAAAAYHTTPPGIVALGFVGNEPRASFDGPPAEVLAHFEVEFAKLRFEP